MSPEERSPEMEQVKRFLEFAEQAPTAFHAIDRLAAMLEQKGMIRLRETDPWLVDAGEQYYVVRNDSSLIAFSVPPTGFAPFRIVAAHSDSPAFRLKQRFEDASEAYLRLNAEKYGGMILSTWLDRPLSIAGRVAIRRNGAVASKLVRLDRDAVLIPNLPIHFNRKVNEGYAWDLKTDLMPLYGPGSAKGGLIREIAAAAGAEPEEIIGHDLFLYNREKGSIWGAEDAYFSCARIDDLECAWGCMTAFAQTRPRNCISVCAVFDNEEVGSGTRQGAQSDFLANTLTRIGLSLGASAGEIMATTAGSFLVSADNAHALHPNHPELYDAQNRVYMNQGVVIKHNANQKYTTDAMSSAEFEMICESAGVPVQHFANRSDLPGGSTLGNLSNTQVSMSSVDIGLAQLAMHSLYETAGTKDLSMLIQAMTAYWEA